MYDWREFLDGGLLPFAVGFVIVLAILLVLAAWANSRD